MRVSVKRCSTVLIDPDPMGTSRNTIKSNIGEEKKINARLELSILTKVSFIAELCAC